jgi:hypothetical protein
MSTRSTARLPNAADPKGHRFQPIKATAYKGHRFHHLQKAAASTGLGYQRL